MANVTTQDLAALQGLKLKGEVLDFKDEDETPEGISLGSLTVRPSGLPVFADGRWVTLPEARFVAKYFRVELRES